MRLSARLGSYFTSEVRERGAVYFRLKRLSYRLVGRFAAHAKVRGNEVYSASILIDHDPEDNRALLSLECDCPHFQSGHPCKHIWAFILALEEEDWADSLGQARILDVEFLHPEDETTSSLNPEARLAKKAETQVRTLPWDVFKNRIQPAAATIRNAHRIEGGGEILPCELIFVLDTRMGLESGDLALQFFARELSKSGRWSPFRPRALWSELSRDFTADEDRRLFRQLTRECDGFKLTQSSYSSRSGRIALAHKREIMDGVLLPPEEALKHCALIAAQGKLYTLGEGGKKAVPRPLSVKSGPWNLEVQIVDHDEKNFALKPTFVRGDDSEDISGFEILSDGRFALFDSTLVPLSLYANRHQDWLTQLSQDLPVTFAKKDFDTFVIEYSRLPGTPGIRWPEGFTWNEIVASPRPKLRLSPYYFAGKESLAGAVLFAYPQEEVNSLNEVPSWIDETFKTITFRDFGAERHHLQVLGKHSSVHTVTDADLLEEGKTVYIHPSDLALVVDQLEEAGWLIEVGEKRLRMMSDFSIVADGETDWFDLTVTVQIDAKSYRIPELLKNQEEGEIFLPLGNHELAILPQQWRERFEMLKKSGTMDEESFRIPSPQVLLIDSLLSEVVIDNRSEKLKAVQEKIRSFKALMPVDPPGSFAGVLRDYQKEGLAWLEFLQDFGFGGCLSDEMGLGKTVQVLAMLLRYSEQEGSPPSLVVVPRSLVSNWLAEAKSFCPSLRVVDMSGSGRNWEAVDEQSPQLILTTYGLLRQDIKALSSREFGYVVLDESQVIKNPNSQASRAARLLQSRYRLAMSGTPVENHMRELMSLMRFLNPGLLDSPHWVETFKKKFDASEPSFKSLITAIRPLMLRRTKRQVLKDLPEKVEDVLYCDLEGEQRKHYDELKLHYQMNLLPKLQDETWKQSSIVVIEALLRLRQAACHSALVDPRFADVSSAKLETLRDKLQEIILSGHKALIFSQFTSFLKVLAKQLKAEGIPFEYLDGSTRDRAARVERFQTDPEIPLFLISLKAGGVGLNLTAADYCFILDPWWNPAAEAQAIDRAHRIHQKNTVFAYRLIARDTVEEKIQALQKAKQDMVAQVLDGEGALLKELDLKSIRSLFS